MINGLIPSQIPGKLSGHIYLDHEDMQEVITSKANIDHLLGLTDAQKNKEMER